MVAGITLLAAPRHAAATQAAIEETSIVTALVTDTAGRALSGVEVTVIGTDLRQLTDDSGQIYMAGVPSRKVTLHVRHVGYREADLELFLTPGVRTSTTMVLRRSPVVATTLPKVVVRSDLVPARYAGTSRFDDFYRRKSDGIGTFLTREFMDSRAADRPEDILRSVAGIRIRYRGSKPYIDFIRCEQVEVYINGFRSHDGFTSFLELNPREIEAMEIYRGVATVPPEFSPQPNDCAAVVVWTRWH
jgi:hypothetical protein